jgi:hypothetical protein
VRPRHTADNTAQGSPITLPSPSQEALELLKAALDVIMASERALEGGKSLRSGNTLGHEHSDSP